MLADEGASPSGERVAEIGMVAFKADGAYAADGSGFGILRLHSALPADEDGGVGIRTTPYVFAVSAAGEVIALRTDNAVLGLARFAPAR